MESVYELLQLIQEKLFDNYEEWRLKSPDYNRNGFNIVGIDNTLKAMEDGFSCIWSYIPPLMPSMVVPSR